MGIAIDSVQMRDVKVLSTEAFEDDRGFFMEVYRADQYATLGLPTYFPQDNHSRSAKGVLRGLHFQWDPPQGKLIRVTVGTAFLAAKDRRHSGSGLGLKFQLKAKNNCGSRWDSPTAFAPFPMQSKSNTSVQRFIIGIVRVVFAGTIRR